MATGKSAWLRTVIERSAKELGEEFSAPSHFRLHAVRTPAYHDVLDKGKPVLDKLTGKVKREFFQFETGLFTEAGERVGSYKDWAARKLYPEIERGVLPGSVFGKVYQLKKSKHLLIGTAERAKDLTWEWNKIPYAQRATGTAYHQRVIEDIVSGKKGKAVDMLKRDPTKYFAPKIVDTTKAATKMPSVSKYLIAGAAITAGALLAYSAFKSSRQRPIDERDIPKSMYGDATRTPQTDGLPTYQPQARMIQTNRPGEFDTNIDMETEDFNNTMDYKQLANTMSQISRGAIGTDRINTSLHVTDDSSSVDSRNIQRQFAEYLNR